jgi:murein DD-endopeptidase MepM/ murein hydrolase activator NlpD
LPVPPVLPAAPAELAAPAGPPPAPSPVEPPALPVSAAPVPPAEPAVAAAESAAAEAPAALLVPAAPPAPAAPAVPAAARPAVQPATPAAEPAGSLIEAMGPDDVPLALLAPAGGGRLATSRMATTSLVATRRAAVVAVGRRFQPLPGTPPVRSDPAGAALVAVAGTPVHAIEAGVVRRSGDGRLRVCADGGLDIGYAGLAPASITVGDGEQVPAGAVLGSLATVTRGTTRLLLDVRDAAGEVIDAAGVLLGLPDPTELGHAPVGEGLGRDPDALDRELAAAQLPAGGG